MSVRLACATALCLLLFAAEAFGGWRYREEPEQRWLGKARITVPAGWSDNKTDGQILMTLTSPGFQLIMFDRMSDGDVFNNLDDDDATGMPIEDIAARWIEHLEAGERVESFELDRTSILETAGRPTFRIRGRMTVDDGLVLETVMFGFEHRGGIYYLEYSAPTLDLFERELDTVDRIRSGIELR